MTELIRDGVDVGCETGAETVIAFSAWAGGADPRSMITFAVYVPGTRYVHRFVAVYDVVVTAFKERSAGVVMFVPASARLQ